MARAVVSVCECVCVWIDVCVCMSSRSCIDDTRVRACVHARDVSMRMLV